MAGGVAPGAVNTTGLTGTPGTQGAARAPSGFETLNPADYGDRFSQTPEFYNPLGGYGQTTLSDYFASLPSYQQPGGSSQGNTRFAEDLAAQSQAAMAQQDAALKAAEQQRVADSAAALKAYQERLADQQWQARLDALNNEMSTMRSTMIRRPSGSNPYGIPGWSNSSDKTLYRIQGDELVPYENTSPFGPNYNYDAGLAGASGGLASLKGFNK